MNLVYLNGSYPPLEEARLPITDRGFTYGDGVFTMLKVSEWEPLFLEKHLARLARDAAAIRLTAPVREIEAACIGLVSRLGMESGILKAVLTRGAGERGLSTKNASGSTVLVSASDLPPPRPHLRAVTVPDERGSLAAHKTLNYLPNVLALRRAEEAGRDEAIFVRDGFLLEATISNLVGVVGGRLLRPPLGGRVLGGVIREVLLEEHVVFEGDLPAESTGSLYCVNSVRGVETVVELDDRPLPTDPELQTLFGEILTRRTPLGTSLER